MNWNVRWHKKTPANDQTVNKSFISVRWVCQFSSQMQPFFICLVLAIFVNYIWMHLSSICTEILRNSTCLKKCNYFLFVWRLLLCLFYLYILITSMPRNCKKMRMPNKLNAGSFVPLNDEVYAFNEWVQLLTYEMWRFQ